MKRKVLLVDDDYDIRKFISANLKARGYEVIQAADGIEAISILNDRVVDVIILDISMPRMDGFEVCKLVRKWSNTPIIMLSARQDVSDKAKCFELGADAYVTKPFGLREFIARVDAVIRRGTLNNTASQGNSSIEHV